MAQLQGAGLGELVLAGLNEVDGLGDIVVEQPPVGGQADAAGGAGKQPGLKLLLELLDGLADGGLGDVEALGRGGDVARLCHLFEYPVKFQLRGHGNASLS